MYISPLMCCVHFPSDVLCGTALMPSVNSAYIQPCVGVFGEVKAGEGLAMEKTAQEDSSHNRRLLKAVD